MAAPKPIWVRQAEEAKLKSEAETAAAAKAAFDATFKALSASAADQDQDDEDDPHKPSSPAQADRDADSDSDDRHHAPPGPVDPSKSSAAGPGIAGGSAGAPATFTVVAKDRDARRVTTGGARVRVRISPAAGVGGDDLDGAVKDNGDGSYAVTYVVPKRGNYMVHVNLDGSPVMGSPFPVFFSASTSSTTTFPTTLPAVTSAYPNMVNQTMPNMPNYAGALSVSSGAFPSLLGLIPGASTGATGGVVLPGVGASLGEICRDHINGRCTKPTDCKFTHPPQQLLMSVLAATTSVGALSQAPMAPSAAAMAAAQAIMAAQALQAHAAQMQADSKAAGEASGSTDKVDKGDALKKMVQISNLSPLLTADHLKQLFGYCGKVVDCTITDSRHIAYVEYSKPEEATAALALNNMDVGGRPLNVEMAKSLPPKTSLANSNLPMMMQQAVQLQQMQFQQALLMQQTIAAQQAAARAATMKSATEAAAARAAEISRKLKAEGFGGENVEEKNAKGKSRSPSPPSRRSKSRSRSPIKYRRSRRSRSYSPPVRRSREHRSRSPSRSYHSKYGSDRPHRDDRDKYSRSGRRESGRSRDHYSSSSRRNKSRSISPRYKKPSRADSRSPKPQREESLSPSKSRRSARAGSRSPRHHKGSKSSPTRDHHSSRHSRHSRSRSQERKHHNSDKKDSKKSEMQDDKRRSYRDNRGDRDERSVKDPMEDKKVDASAVAHKRSSSVSEDEILNSDNSYHKRSRHGAALEYDERKDEKHIADGAGMTGDKRDVDSPRSKSEKRSLEDDDSYNQNHDTSRNTKMKTDNKKYDRDDKMKTDNKKYDRDDSSRKDRKYREDESRHSRDKSSRHSSSRSHRSSRHSRERYNRDAADQHKSKKSEEGARARKDDFSLDDPLSSDKREVQKESSPHRKHNQSAAGSDADGIKHDTEVRLPNSSLEEADLATQEVQQFARETDVSSADVPLPALNREDPFPTQEAKEDVCSTVADLNGQPGAGVDGALGGTEESVI